METILLMFSGGLDSTYLLHHYLTQTDLPLHVHHISLRYSHLQRWKMEDPAVQAILGYCREHYRPFDYSESCFEMNNFRLIGWDSDLQLLVASKVAPNLPGHRVSVALGQCVGDLESPEVQERFRRQTMTKLWVALVESVDKEGRVNPELARPLIDLRLTKTDLCRKMPPELLRLCWSCRKPLFVEGKGQPCGHCPACRKNERALRALGRQAEFPNLVRQGNSGAAQVRWDLSNSRVGSERNSTGDPQE